MAGWPNALAPDAGAAPNADCPNAEVAFVLVLGTVELEPKAEVVLAAAKGLLGVDVWPNAGAVVVVDEAAGWSNADCPNAEEGVDVCPKAGVVDEVAAAPNADGAAAAPKADGPVGDEPNADGLAA